MVVETVLKHDLPDRFGSMLVKEMRQNMRRGSFVIPFLGLHLLAVMAIAIEFQTGADHRYYEAVGMFNIALLFNNGPIWIVAAAICGLIMPLAGLIMMGQELDEGNHELLLLTRLSRWKIVCGKFFCLWALSLLALISLVPYVMVRYQMGGVELTRDLACLMTVGGGSAIVTAGAIGSSAFKTLAGRFIIMVLFLCSALLCGAIAIVASGVMTQGAGVMWHINALATVFGFVLMGLAIARSRLRLVVHAYEMKPSYMVVGLMIFAAFAVGIITALTAGLCGFMGLIGIGLLAAFSDQSPKAPKWVKTPAPNIPKPEPVEN